MTSGIVRNVLVGTRPARTGTCWSRTRSGPRPGWTCTGCRTGPGYQAGPSALPKSRANASTPYWSTGFQYVMMGRAVPRPRLRARTPGRG